MIEGQVKERPERVAVVFENEGLTYGELNRRANQLAHYLIDLGVKREVPVALFLDRSLELAVAVLALLKAGAVNVPLDPEFPDERIALLLADAAPSLIVTESHLAHRLTSIRACVHCLDQERNLIAARCVENPGVGIVADNLCAYVYTSGSTGRPKAVMVSHRIASRIQWSHRREGVCV
jgi:non-ribosomal peptide synthetase component F